MAASHNIICCWLVVLGFNATLTTKVISWRSVTHVFPGFLKPVLTNFSFQSHRLLFSHASAEVRGKSMLERMQKYASTGDPTHNHKVMSPTPQGHESDTLTTERGHNILTCISIDTECSCKLPPGRD